jgi:hypothetical protein
MVRAALRIVVAVLLVLGGWAAGVAQSSDPSFEIVVSAPVGETTIQCARGCRLAWVERGVNPNARPDESFTFRCSGATRRCSSARVGGWITP